MTAKRQIFGRLFINPGGFANFELYQVDLLHFVGRPASLLGNLFSKRDKSIHGAPSLHPWSDGLRKGSPAPSPPRWPTI